MPAPGRFPRLPSPAVFPKCHLSHSEDPEVVFCRHWSLLLPARLGFPGDSDERGDGRGDAGAVCHRRADHAVLEPWQGAAAVFLSDRAGTEIDILIECNDILEPVEVKRNTNPGVLDIKAFRKVAGLGIPLSHGAVICPTELPLPLTSDVSVIPATAI